MFLRLDVLIIKRTSILCQDDFLNILFFSNARLTNCLSHVIMYIIKKYRTTVKIPEGFLAKFGNRQTQDILNLGRGKL